MSQMTDDFAKYTDRYGLVQNRLPDAEGETSGNGLLFTAEAIIVQQNYGPLTETQRRSYLAAIKSCQVIPGLYNRFPKDTDQEAVDDYIGLLAMSKALGEPAIASDIMSYGEQSRYSWGPFRLRYYYENENPYNTKDIRAWLGRFPFFRAHAAFCGGSDGRLIDRIGWCISVASSGFRNPDDTNAWTLSWVLVNSMNEHSLLCHLGAAIWRYRLKRQWGSMRAVFTRYFGDASHPIVRYCKD